MKTHKQIQKMAQTGQQDEAYKEVRRYGVITFDHSFSRDEGFYKGENRIMTITYREKKYSVELLNGEVRLFGWDE